MDTPYIDVAVDAARKAGIFIQQNSTKLSSLTIEQKQINDFVSEVDRGAELLIRDTILACFPDHYILGEEYGVANAGFNAVEWIIDPLDGTTNFIRGIPHYAVSIGVKVDGVLEAAVVFDPSKDEMFVAQKGKGARCNELPISASSCASVQGSLLSTGVPFNGQTLSNLSMFTDCLDQLLHCQTAGVRRFGAAALDLAYVAAGRYDGYWEANLKAWDIAAGVLLVEEAGGQVSDFNGKKDYLTSGHVVASASAMHREMQGIVAAAYRGW